MEDSKDRLIGWANTKKERAYGGNIPKELFAGIYEYSKCEGG